MKTVVFEPIGPVPIPVTKEAAGKTISKADIKTFWESGVGKELASRTGCYVFAISAGGGLTPYYVGKATKSFKQEIFQHHKLTGYFGVLAKVKRGKPVFLFAVHPVQKGVDNKVAIGNLEDFLIQSAVAANPDGYVNVKGTKPPNWAIKGVFGKKGRGKPSVAADDFKRCFGL